MSRSTTVQKAASTPTPQAKGKQVGTRGIELKHYAASDGVAVSAVKAAMAHAASAYASAASTRSSVKQTAASASEHSPLERIEALRAGIPAEAVADISGQMGWSREHAIEVLKLKRTTVLRKIRQGAPLDTPDSERLLSVLDMIDDVSAIVSRSGTMEGFDAGKWLARWLEAPNPALGGALPADYLDTVAGSQIVRGLIAQMETGAYA